MGRDRGETMTSSPSSKGRKVLYLPSRLVPVRVASEPIYASVVADQDFDPSRTSLRFLVDPRIGLST